MKARTGKNKDGSFFAECYIQVEDGIAPLVCNSRESADKAAAELKAQVEAKGYKVVKGPDRPEWKPREVSPHHRRGADPQGQDQEDPENSQGPQDDPGSGDDDPPSDPQGSGEGEPQPGAEVASQDEGGPQDSSGDEGSAPVQP